MSPLFCEKSNKIWPSTRQYRIHIQFSIKVGWKVAETDWKRWLTRSAAVGNSVNFLVNADKRGQLQNKVSWKTESKKTSNTRLLVGVKPETMGGVGAAGEPVAEGGTRATMDENRCKGDKGMKIGVKAQGLMNADAKRKPKRNATEALRRRKKKEAALGRPGPGDAPGQTAAPPSGPFFVLPVFF